MSHAVVPVSSAAGFSSIDVGFAVAAPVNTARPSVGSRRGCAWATPARPARTATQIARDIARNVSLRYPAAMFVRLVLIAILVAGCEKTTHENIDKWTHTEKGPDKLRHAVADESIDPDLSAHAAANMMVKTGKDKDALDL